MRNSPAPQHPTFEEMQTYSFICYSVAVCVLVIGFWRLCNIEASDVEFLIGSLLTLNLAAIAAFAGFVLPVVIRRWQLARIEK